MSNPIPYVGDKPYLFISYARKDSKSVMRILKHLKKLGVRFWYDEAINASTELSDELSAKIRKCTIFLAFFTENYYLSDWCKKEFIYADKKKKQKLIVKLQDEDIPGEFEFMMCGILMVLKSECHDKKSFYQEILGAKKMPDCIGEPEFEAEEDEEDDDDAPFSFDMRNSSSYCIGDSDNDGCEIIEDESSASQTVVSVDFSQTESDLSSLVFFNSKDLSDHAWNHMALCFDALADTDHVFADLEVRYQDGSIDNNIRKKDKFVFDTKEKQFRISLDQILSDSELWENVTEIKILFRRKKVTAPVKITIKNLRIDNHQL